MHLIEWTFRCKWFLSDLISWRRWSDLKIGGFALHPLESAYAVLHATDIAEQLRFPWKEASAIASSRAESCSPQ